jgi:hypothetical protein
VQPGNNISRQGLQRDGLQRVVRLRVSLTPLAAWNHLREERARRLRGTGYRHRAQQQVQVLGREPERRGLVLVRVAFV